MGRFSGHPCRESVRSVFFLAFTTPATSTVEVTNIEPNEWVDMVDVGSFVFPLFLLSQTIANTPRCGVKRDDGIKAPGPSIFDGAFEDFEDLLLLHLSPARKTVERADLDPQFPRGQSIADRRADVSIERSVIGVVEELAEIRIVFGCQNARRVPARQKNEGTRGDHKGT